MTSLPAKVLIAPIRFYQRFITPYTPATCRYYPTCSAYAVTALRTHGAVVGTGLTIWRLLRCNPWSDGGIDHVPAKGQLRHRAGEQGEHDGREREHTVGSSPTGAAIDPTAGIGAATDLDAPQSAAAEPMTGRSAA